jgi:hypothetical protein
MDDLGPDLTVVANPEEPENSVFVGMFLGDEGQRLVGVTGYPAR